MAGPRKNNSPSTSEWLSDIDESAFLDLLNNMGMRSNSSNTVKLFKDFIDNVEIFDTFVQKTFPSWIKKTPSSVDNHAKKVKTELLKFLLSLEKNTNASDIAHTLLADQSKEPLPETKQKVRSEQKIADILSKKDPKTSLTVGERNTLNQLYANWLQELITESIEYINHQAAAYQNSIRQIPTPTKTSQVKIQKSYAIPIESNTSKNLEHNIQESTKEVVVSTTVTTPVVDNEPKHVYTKKLNVLNLDSLNVASLITSMFDTIQKSRTNSIINKQNQSTIANQVPTVNTSYNHTSSLASLENRIVSTTKKIKESLLSLIQTLKKQPIEDTNSNNIQKDIFLCHVIIKDKNNDSLYFGIYFRPKKDTLKATMNGNIIMLPLEGENDLDTHISKWLEINQPMYVNTMLGEEPY